MQRCLYAIPNGPIFHTDEIMKLEKDVVDSRISLDAFRTKLQDAASGLINEIAKQLLNLNVSSFGMAPVKRRYAFERSDNLVGENYKLKINYPFMVRIGSVAGNKELHLATFSQFLAEEPVHELLSLSLIGSGAELLVVPVMVSPLLMTALAGGGKTSDKVAGGFDGAEVGGLCGGCGGGTYEFVAGATS